MSDFDPNDVVDEQPQVSDFDSRDIISNEPQAISKMEQPEEIEEVGLAPVTEQIIAPAAGYMTGRATQEAISKTGELAEKGLEKIAKMGGTSPEQLNLIKENFRAFKVTDPLEEMNKLLASARGTNVDVNKMYAEAEKLLADKKITPDQYKSIVQKTILEKNKYGQRTFAKPISQSEIQKADIRVLGNLKEEAIKKEEKMLDDFAKLKANEAVKKADFEYKITNATKQELPKSIESEIKNNIINQVKTNPQEFGFEGLGSEIFKDYDYRIKKEVEALQTPLAKEFPFLEGTSIVPSEERAFQKILKMPSEADITGNRLQEMLREFRDVGFTEGGQLSDKPAASMSQEVRKEIARMSPEAGKLMEAENIELNKLEALEKAGYINRTGEGLKTAVEMTDAQRNKIVKDLATSFDKASPTDVTENLQVLKNYLPEVEYKKLELAAINMAEKKAGDIDYLPSNILNKILNALRLRKVSRSLATLPEAAAYSFPKTTMATKLIGKGAYKLIPTAGALVGGIAAQAAEEGLSPEASGATPQMEDYWWERGVRDPEEQRQRALLSSFKEGLPSKGRIDEMPSAYEKPEIRQRKEQVMAAKKAGALAPTYVEAPKAQVLKADNPAEIASMAQALQSGQDKASQEYGRVLSQIVDAPAREKESILFGLNQQPAFRELVRKLKDQQKTEEETPLMLRGPA